MADRTLVERAGTGAGPAVAWCAFVVGELAGLGLVWAQAVLDQRVHPPTCSGIGWGCTPDPATSAFLVGFFVGVPALIVATVLVIVGGVIGRSSPQAGGATVLLPVGLLGVVLVVMGVATVAALA